MTPLLLSRSLPPVPQPKDQNTCSGTAGEILPRRCHTKLPIYLGVSKWLFDFDVANANELSPRSTYLLCTVQPFILHPCPFWGSAVRYQLGQSRRYPFSHVHMAVFMKEACHVRCTCYSRKKLLRQLPIQLVSLALRPHISYDKQ